MNTDRVWAFSFTVGVVALYAVTLSPTVSFTDSGELAAVAVQLGIAHPTGYPLFTLLGRVAVLLPAGLGPIRQLNLLAAFLTAAAAGVFFRVILLVLRGNAFGVMKPGDPDSSVVRWIAMFGAATLAFSTSFWSQSTSIEVYSLHLLLIMLTLFWFLRGLGEYKREGLIPRELFLFAFVLGLSFSNHMTTVLLGPGFLFLFFFVLGLRRNTVSLMIVLVPFFLAGLTIYSFLPIRASAFPPQDWGHPVDLNSIWTHITGKQYRVWMFSGSESFRKQLAYFFSNFAHEFVVPAILLMGVGLVVVVRRSIRMSLFFGLLFVSTLLYAANYDIHDIDSYFLLCFISSTLVMAIGMLAIARRFPKGGPLTAAVILVGIVLVGYQWHSNFSLVNQSNNTAVASFTEAATDPLEPGSLVIASLWDYFVSPMLYFQAVDRNPKQLVVIDKSLLQNRVWYVEQMRRNNAWLFDACARETDLFLQDLRKFERGESFNPALIQTRWDALLEAMIVRALGEKVVYVDYRIEPEMPKRFIRTPSGMMVRLSLHRVVQTPMLPLEIQFHSFHLPVGRDLVQYSSGAFFQQGLFLRGQGFGKEASAWFRAATLANPQLIPYLPTSERGGTLPKSEVFR